MAQCRQMHQSHLVRRTLGVKACADVLLLAMLLNSIFSRHGLGVFSAAQPAVSVGLSRQITKTCKRREGLIQELRGSMYSLLDAFKGDYTQQAMHYEQRMLQLQNTFQTQLASSSPAQAASDKQPGTKFHSTM